MPSKAEGAPATYESLSQTLSKDVSSMDKDELKDYQKELKKADTSEIEKKTETPKHQDIESVYSRIPSQKKLELVDNGIKYAFEQAGVENFNLLDTKHVTRLESGKTGPINLHEYDKQQKKGEPQIFYKQIPLNDGARGESPKFSDEVLIIVRMNNGSELINPPKPPEKPKTPKETDNAGVWAQYNLDMDRYKWESYYFDMKEELRKDGGKTVEELKKEHGVRGLRNEENTVFVMVAKIDTSTGKPDLTGARYNNMLSEEQFDKMQRSENQSITVAGEYDKKHGVYKTERKTDHQAVLDAELMTGHLTLEKYNEQYQQLNKKTFIEAAQQRDKELVESTKNDMRFADLDERYAEIKRVVGGEYAHVIESRSEKLDEIKERMKGIKQAEKEETARILQAEAAVVRDPFFLALLADINNRSLDRTIEKRYRIALTSCFGISEDKLDELLGI